MPAVHTVHRSSSNPKAGWPLSVTKSLLQTHFRRLVAALSGMEIRGPPLAIGLDANKALR